jgi:hypothetical protein
MTKWIAVAVAIALLAAGVGWWNWNQSPMREMERSRAAAERATNWHYHSLRFNRFDSNAPPETLDVDTFCPTFQHISRTTFDRSGAPSVTESIVFFGRAYNRIGNTWVLGQGRQIDVNAQGSLPIFECLKGAIGSDENSLPYKAIIEDGTLRPGGLREAGRDSCRDFEITVPTPKDPAEKEFRFSMCVNEQDHLPRETRRTPPGATAEGISSFTQWNALTEPQLPTGFSK